MHRLHPAAHISCEAPSEVLEPSDPHGCPSAARARSGLATGSAYPSKDADGNTLQTEYGESEYIDHQQITLQACNFSLPARLCSQLCCSF